MAYTVPSSRTNYGQVSPPRASPLRHISNASTNSSAYSGYSNPFLPSRTSTISSSASSGYNNYTTENRGGGASASHRYSNSTESSPSSAYKTVRQSLRPLPQPPSSQPPPHKTSYSPTLDTVDQEDIPDSLDGTHSAGLFYDSSPPRGSHMRTMSLPPEAAHHGHHSPTVAAFKGMHSHHPQNNLRPSTLERPDLAELQKSSTSHLKTLSKLSQDSSGDGFSITAPMPSVAGLHNRRQLKRGDSVRGARPGRAQNTIGSEWNGRNWMDKQRQFLQAYEYLCHIGEAKEWIQDIIHKPIPAIVQLEQALRDGVTLAEVVQALKPGNAIRIFRHPKLQFRHSDNIAVFFRFLNEVELPELFRFELVDLYEKKNIPKVIYCIHALSYLLYRNGMVDFRIGNLVGQLEFEHHELEEVQRGLDRAGVSMPNFSGMSANFGAEPEPPPEPVETEEERVDRELHEHELEITELQSQVRGCLIRFRLGETMQKLWDAESALTELQSHIRGDWARQIFDYKIGMRRFATNLQSASRGYLARQRQLNKEANWKRQEPQVIKLQSLIRARKAREATQLFKSRMCREESGVRQFQAAIRGALTRKRVGEQFEEAELSQGGIELFQAAARGMMQRRRFQELAAHLRQSQRSTVALQSAARAMATRIQQARQQAELQRNNPIWRALQAVSRGLLERNRVFDLKKELKCHKQLFITLQAHSRGTAVRRHLQDLKASLSTANNEAVRLQAASRGLILRAKIAGDKRALRSCEPSIIPFQAMCRGFSSRQRRADFLRELHSHQEEVVQLQAMSRAMLVRLEVGAVLAQLDEEEPAIEALQAAIRGMIVRAKFAEKQRFFKKNMEKVIKVQSYVRAKLQGEAYKSLTSGKNPPVGTVKNFIHLLNDSDFDFDEEIEFERLRKTVVQQVRQNEMADQYIQQLDIKIALLVKNKITLDEVVKHQKHFGGSVAGLLQNPDLSSKDPFDLKALNKNSRRKLEHYQELFFALQTQPQYLARLFKKIREQATPEKETEKTRHLMMGVFGYAQKRREEYYLIKLITRSVKEEVDSCQSLQDYLRGNYFWTKLFSAYIKSPRDRKFLRDLLSPIVKTVVENANVDLESDPLVIYNSLVQNEQLRTGQRSVRQPNVSREEAIRDRETKGVFVNNLQDLRDITGDVFAGLENLLHKMPYGVRFVAQQMFHHLCTRFQHEEQGHLLQVTGHWLWKNYLQPALLEPEKFGVIDRGLAPDQKKNLGEIVKVVNQVAAGRLFGNESVFLQPLNSFVGDSIGQLSNIWNQLIDVPDSETQFDIDEFNDLYAKTKPTLYIKMADIFSIHHLIANDISYICPPQDDMLRNVIRELGSAKTNESELFGVSNSEICLTLNPKLHNAEDPDAEFKALFMETKRCILYLIRVQSGASLMDIMVKPITHEDEDRWRGLVQDELLSTSRKRGAYSEANTLLDLASMNYPQLKRTALENIIQLERMGRLTKHNNYQDLLNAIAVDIRTKHRRRIQRQRELEGVRLTLARLNDQAGYLDQQLKTYNDYIEQAMVTLQNKKGKKRFLMPFTKQWNHERELQLSGRTPRFGSYKYSAAELANRGVLVMWQGYSDRQWHQLDLTVSSNEVGVFNLEGSSGSITMPGASASISLDDLLQAQYNGTPFLEFFDEGQKVRVNVNLFLHLIMKKFYKERD